MLYICFLEFSFEISVILGIGSGMITLITFTEAEIIKGEKGKIAGILSFGHAIGAILCPILGGIIVDIFGVRAIFLSFVSFFGAMALYTFINFIKWNKSGKNCLIDT